MKILPCFSQNCNLNYSSPQFSPAFSEPPSPWVNPEDDGSATLGSAPSNYSQRSHLKMEADEALGPGATISSVLYANLNHPEWKTEYPGKLAFLKNIQRRLLLNSLKDVKYYCNWEFQYHLKIIITRYFNTQRWDTNLDLWTKFSPLV